MLASVCPASKWGPINRIRAGLKEHNTEVTVVRLVLESGINILLWVLIALIHASKHGFGLKHSDRFSNTLAIIMLIALMISPAHMIIRAR